MNNKKYLKLEILSVEVVLSHASIPRLCTCSMYNCDLRYVHHFSNYVACLIYNILCTTPSQCDIVYLLHLFSIYYIENVVFKH